RLAELREVRARDVRVDAGVLRLDRVDLGRRQRVGGDARERLEGPILAAGDGREHPTHPGRGAVAEELRLRVQTARPLVRAVLQLVQDVRGARGVRVRRVAVVVDVDVPGAALGLDVGRARLDLGARLAVRQQAVPVRVR